jgi:excisionase family DNA binding protein
METNTVSPWLTVREAAEYLKLKPRTLRNYISRGLLPIRRSAETNTARLHRDDLDNWLMSGDSPDVSPVQNESKAD